MKKNLTVAFVESVTPPTHGRVTYWDTTLRTYGSFGLRVTDKGQMTWVAVYRDRTTHDQKWLTLGTWPSTSVADARADARKKLGLADAGKDPATEKQESRREAREADSFDELAHRYLDEYADVKQKPGTAAENRRVVEKDLIPYWGKLRARDIQRSDVKKRINQIVARGAAVGANRVLMLISKIFNWAIEEEVSGVESNPAHKVKPPTDESERARDRVLNREEISAFWKALESDEPDVTRDAMRLLMLTGQRPSEVRELRWSEVDIPAELGPHTTCVWWLLPGGRTGRTKNRKAHRIPFVGEALKIILSRLHDRGENEFVFPGRDKKSPFASWQKVHARIVETAGFEFQPRDLRRTGATGFASLHVDRTTIKRILNHSEGDITEVYERHTFDREKIDALTKWDRHLKRLLAGAESPKVIALASRL